MLHGSSSGCTSNSSEAPEMEEAIVKRTEKYNCFESLRGKKAESFSESLTEDDVRCAECSKLSIIRPITINEARSRSNAVGYRDYLMKNENFHRFFPDGKIKIFVATWNKNSKDAPEDMQDLLLPQSIQSVPDLYVLGVQESSHINDNDWEIEIQRTIGPSHVLLHSASLGVLNLDVYIRRDLIWYCSLPEDATFNSKIRGANMIKSKGAIAISFQLFGTTLLFINSHFPAHEECLKDRIEAYEKIAQSLDLPRNLLPLKPKYYSDDVTGRFDLSFWFGDFNFRVERPYLEVVNMLKHKKVNYKNLLQHDQLRKSMEEGLLFRDFSEAGEITFPPTYKYEVNTTKYDVVHERVPSYTDRILVRSKRKGDVSCMEYNHVPTLLTSDHRPVYAVFDVQLNPGRNIKSLNAGRFDREVGIEAIRRQAKIISDRSKSDTVECRIS